MEPGSLEFKVEANKSRDVTVINIYGPGDVDYFKSVKSFFSELVTGGGRKFIFDLSNTSSLEHDSVGILMGAYNLARRSGGKVIFYFDQEQENIRRLFKNTGMTDIVDIYDSLEDALAFYRGQETGDDNPKQIKSVSSSLSPDDSILYDRKRRPVPTTQKTKKVKKTERRILTSLTSEIG